MSSRTTSFKKFALVLAFAVITSVLFGFLGAPILRVLRNVFGSYWYWISGALIAGLLLAINFDYILLALLLLSFWVTVGVYQELEERGFAGFYSALISSMLGTLVLIIGPYIFSALSGFDIQAQLKMGLEENLKQFLGGKDLADYGLKLDVILSQIPSIVALVQISCLGFALMFDRRMAALFGVRYENIASRMKLLEFRTPNYLIWIAMLSFLLSFMAGVPAIISKIGMNIFIVLMGIYFFHGLAITEYLFLVLRTGAIVKALIYILIIGQLFFLLSLVGLIDFWADFRLKIKRWKMSEK